MASYIESVRKRLWNFRNQITRNYRVKRPDRDSFKAEIESLKIERKIIKADVIEQKLVLFPARFHRMRVCKRFASYYEVRNVRLPYVHVVAQNSALIAVISLFDCCRAWWAVALLAMNWTWFNWVGKWRRGRWTSILDHGERSPRLRGRSLMARDANGWWAFQTLLRLVAENKDRSNACND